MIDRARHRQRILEALDRQPVVALLGARQVGKTTLARDIMNRFGGPAVRFDLEDPDDLARLDEPKLALGSREGLVVIDEVQRRPDLFPVLRVLVDRPDSKARFLVLGSASPELLRQTSETTSFPSFSAIPYARIGCPQPAMITRCGFEGASRVRSWPPRTARVLRGAAISSARFSSATSRSSASGFPPRRFAVSGP